MQRVKKDKPFRKRYWPVVVYFDELRELVEIMKAVSKRVEVSSADYKFESLEDAKEYFGNRPQFDFSIASGDPYAEVEFSRMGTKLYVQSGEKAAQLYHDLDGILVRQQRTLSILYPSPRRAGDGERPYWC